MSYQDLIAAADFAAHKHRHQRRKGEEDTGDIPYVNHPIRVAKILSNEGGVEDVAILMAALLHDTVEDTETSPEELVSHFGEEVKSLVLEVTDDKSQPKAVRKQHQIDHAPHLTDKAKQLKIADKIANLRDLLETPPNWTLERKQTYFDWAHKVVAGARGINPKLEAAFDAAYGRKGELE